MNNIKSRIKAHKRVRAGDLVPHELNPRVHSDEQREALQALYEEIGFARSVLAFELPDGRLKLIDGHLRQSMDPNMEVDVEVLDVTEDEAKKLLLSIDPLAQLADYDEKCLDELRAQADTDNETLAALWSTLRKQDNETVKAIKKKTKKDIAIPEQFLVLIECQSEQEQVKLLRRLKQEGLTCKAMTS